MPAVDATSVVLPAYRAKVSGALEKFEETEKASWVDINELLLESAELEEKRLVNQPILQEGSL